MRPLLLALALLAAPGGAVAGAVSGVQGTLDVTCVPSCASGGGGTASNNADAVATSSTNGTDDAFLYAFNGASWDRLRDDSGKNLLTGLLDCEDVTLGCKADGATCATTNTAMACLRQIDADIKATGTIQGLGTAGSPSGGVVSVQGVAGGTPITVTPASPAGAANALRGAASATGTGATTLIAAQGAGVKIYVTGLQCGRTDAGTSAITLTFSDSASTVMVLPNLGGGGASNMALATPLATAANAALTFAASSGVTTAYCNAQGFSGS